MKLDEVSFTGKICIIDIPVRFAQSAISFRSLNSPTPQLFSLRSENTGIATPAPRHISSFDVRQRRPLIMADCESRNGIMRLLPPSYRLKLPSRSVIMNLYSEPIASSGSSIFHVGAVASFICTACSTFQLPNTAEPPTIASRSSWRSVGASTSRSIDLSAGFSIFQLPTRRRNTTSVKNDE